MSPAPNSHDSVHGTGHEGPIQTPRQLAVAVVLAFLVPILTIVLLVTFVSNHKGNAPGSDALSAQATAERIMPVGSVEIKAVSANAGPRSGEEVFKAQCATCHASGALGAPKFGDAAAWSARIGAGLSALAHSAIAGKNNMPPQGGGDYSDLEITRAAAYLADAGGAKFAEPAAPAAASSAASSAADPSAKP